MGGAIRLEESELVYEVTGGKTVTNAGNLSGAGGFIAFSGNAGNVIGNGYTLYVNGAALEGIK